MSSILKALRKLEEDKVRRGETTVEIACDILRREPRTRRRLAGLVPVVGLALILGGGVFIYRNLDLNPGTGREPSGKGPAVAVTTDLAIPQTAGKVAEGQIAGEPKAEPDPAPAAGEPPEIARRSVAAASMKPATKTVAASKEPSITARAPERPEPTPEETSRPAAAPAAPGTEEAKARAPLSRDRHPDLTVSGIAYREAPDSRLAIVNDLPVMEGTRIEGVVVEKILADRVRFSSAGKEFEVVLQP